jgi:hypothetical protein
LALSRPSYKTDADKTLAQPCVFQELNDAFRGLLNSVHQETVLAVFDLPPDRTNIAPMTAAPFHIASVTVRKNPSRINRQKLRLGRCLFPGVTGTLSRHRHVCRLLRRQLAGNKNPRHPESRTMTVRRRSIRRLPGILFLRLNNCAGAPRRSALLRDQVGDLPT